MTWEETIKYIRNKNEYAQLVKDAYFDDPIEKVAERFYGSTEYSALKEFLPSKKGRILDIGAGRGIASYAFAKDGWQAVALEPDISDITGLGAIKELIERTGVKIEIKCCFGENLSFADSYFDVVYCREVLHHAKDLNILCSQISRVLKFGGSFIACREHVINKHSDLDIFLNKHPLNIYYGGENAFMLEEYLTAIKKSGIRIDKILNPFESDINFFPETAESFKEKLVKKFKIIPSFMLSDSVLRIAGQIYNKPGRLYSFIGSKIA